MTSVKKSILSLLLLTGCLLLIPLVSMQFTEEVDWSSADFLFAAVLLFGGLSLGNLAWQKITKPKYRILTVGLLALLFLLTWAELAVGIFGSPVAGS